MSLNCIVSWNSKTDDALLHEDTFIVKVQRSVFTSNSSSMMLIYNKSRSVFLEQRLTKEVRQLLGTRLKAYHRACIRGSHLILGERIKHQYW